MQDVNALENTQQGQPQGAGQSSVGDSPAVQVETGGSRQDDTHGANGRGPNADFARKRYEGKLAERMGNVEQSLSQLVQILNTPRQPQAPSSSGNAPNDFWSDPPAYMQAREDNLRKEFQTQLVQAQFQAKLAVEARMATDYLKSESGNDPEAEEEIKQIGRANRYDLIALQDPLTAAELAVRDWKQWKAGLSAKSAQPIPNGQAPSRAAAIGINGNAAINATRQWNAQEIAKARQDGTYAKHRDEILRAVKSRLGM